jgi:hypothetical protein
MQSDGGDAATSRISARMAGNATASCSMIDSKLA